MRRKVLLGVAVLLVACFGVAIAGLAQQPADLLIVSATDRDASRVPMPIAMFWLKHIAHFDPSQGEPPLLHFALNGAAMADPDRLTQHFEVAELLLARGADINQLDVRLGLTALHVSALNDSTAVMQFLISHGANPNAAANGRYSGLTPIGFIESLKDSGKQPSRAGLYEKMIAILKAAGGG